MTFSSLLISTFKYKLLIWSFDRKIDVNSNMNFLELNNFFDFYYIKIKKCKQKENVVKVVMYIYIVILIYA